MTDTSISNAPVFYTCPAATPDGPPLEVAWAAVAVATTHGVICGSHLIRPAAGWIAELARDAAALQPYGLTLADLQDFGTPPREIAAHMNEALAQRELFSAVPEDDARLRWMFDAAKLTPTFGLRRSDADQLIAALAWLQRLPPAAAVHAKREAAAMCLTGVRAQARARFLATYWGLVVGRD